MKASETDKKNMQPNLDNFSHLMEDLEVYMNQNERRKKRLLKWNNFFKLRPYKKTPNNPGLNNE